MNAFLAGPCRGRSELLHSDADTVIYEVGDGIATVKINRPEIRNALSPAAANRLHDCWGEVDADKSVRVAILTSADCGTFCAGLDLREAACVKKEEGVDILSKMKDPFHGRQRRVAKPIIAAMTGHLIAGGMMLRRSARLCREAQTGVDGALRRGALKCRAHR